MMAILKINIHTHDFGEIKLVTRCWSKWEHEEQHENHWSTLSLRNGLDIFVMTHKMSLDYG